MNHAETIRNAVQTVCQLRERAGRSEELTAAMYWVKTMQARRFEGSYADLLKSREFGPATHFFLHELYSDKDFSERDGQFSRIAGALQTFFPQQVTQTAATLANLHQLTEELDFAMGLAAMDFGALSDAAKYVACWKRVGRQTDRVKQLETVLQVGLELDRLTRSKGLRTMLRMMRRPAHAAGLGALQQFLEMGFDTFAVISTANKHVEFFLNTIRARESELIQSLFAQNTNLCAIKISQLTNNLSKKTPPSLEGGV